MSGQDAVSIAGPGGSVAVESVSKSAWKITVRADPGVFVAEPSVVTRYPVDLIERIVVTKGVAYACDDIAREEDPDYNQRMLGDDLLAYVDPKTMAGARILDFGCGSGASAMYLARTFPQCEIVGVELMPEYLAIARARLAHYGYRNIRFEQSPSGVTVPAELGKFDLVVFSAVFEHLLPREREELMPRIWSMVAPDGRLFINQTPHRYFPTDGHTTGLPLINYLPKSLALPYARRFSKRNLEDDDWSVLLRKGIRGGTEREIMRSLGPGAAARIEQPILHGRSRVNLWYAALSPRLRPVKLAAREVLRAVHALTGTLVTPNVTLVLRKLD